MEHRLSTVLLVMLAGYFGFQVSARQLSAESGAERASKRRTNCGLGNVTDARRARADSRSCQIGLISKAEDMALHVSTKGAGNLGLSASQSVKS